MIRIIALDRHRKADRRRFIEIPHALYGDDPDWVAPLHRHEHRRLSNRDPFFGHGDAQLFVAQRDGRDVGRIAAIENPSFNRHFQEQNGFFGFFACEPKVETVRALVKAVAERLGGRGLRRLLGPTNPSVEHGCGLLVSGEPGPPAVDMPYNPIGDHERLAQAGLRKHVDLLSYRLRFDSPAVQTRMERIARRVSRRTPAKVVPIRFHRFRHEMRRLQSVHDDAFSDHWGIAPLSESGFLHLAADLRIAAVRSCCCFLEVGGDPIGFLCVVYNLNEILIGCRGRLTARSAVALLRARHHVRTARVSLLGMRKAFRGRGLESLLYAHLYREAVALGMKGYELGWMLEDHAGVLAAAEAMGARPHRRYRIMELDLIP